MDSVTNIAANTSLSQGLTALLYLLAASAFIIALRGLSHPSTARLGNVIGMGGMALAVALAWWNSNPGFFSTGFLLIALTIGGVVGLVIARRIAMTDMPQLTAAFHSLVGLAAVFTAAAAFHSPEAFGILRDSKLPALSLLEMSLGAAIGAITFTGSLIAFGKLAGGFSASVREKIKRDITLRYLMPLIERLISPQPLKIPFRHVVNALLFLLMLWQIVTFIQSPSSLELYMIVLEASLLGILLITPIGGADMPVIVSMLNSYSGWATSGIGFTLNNPLLVITGALVGSSGAILSYIMCRAMNRSFLSVIVGGFGNASSSSTTTDQNRPVRSGSPVDAAFILANASAVIIVPGYGMAVSQAQHAVRELYEALEARKIDVRFAIHPVAGRMPGHMNVLLAEARIPYEKVFELDAINSDFSATDVVYVIGANDITNPLARTDQSSPIFGMPILDVEKARSILFIKRSLAAGYAGVDNPLLYNEKTMMLFGDAKKVTEELVVAMKSL